MSKIPIDGLANEIAQTLTQYTKEVEEGMEKEKQKAARKGAKTLRETSPKKRPKYAGSWTSTKRGTKYVIRNKEHYQLTHLLEKGHAKVGGGRVAPRVHIKPVEEQAIKDFEDGTIRVIEGK